MRTLPPIAILLGAAGLIPFVLGSLGALALEGDAATRALLALSAYGAVILSFLGGVHWGFGLQAGADQPATVQRARYGLGVVPSLIGWAGLLVTFIGLPKTGLLIIVAGFVVTTVTEARGAAAGLVPGGYMALRWVLSLVVVVCLTSVCLVLALGGRVRAVSLIDQLADARVVPVIRTATAALAETAVRWLHETGMRVFEITMTVPDAPALIRALSSDPALLVGAGTVADAATATACLDAGARFVVAPWVDPSLSAPCRDAEALLMLGAMTPTEVRAALAAGADVVKIFPASSAGGPSHVRALASVFPGVSFCPTGGIGPGDVRPYIDAGARFVGLGGAIVGSDKAAVQEAARRALQ